MQNSQGKTLKKQLTEFQDRCNVALQKQLTHYAAANADLNEFYSAIHYATLNAGKRLRPALIYAVAEALSVPIEKVDSSACAIEFIHSYSLVHDDLPAMDDDDLRRGEPTAHIKYGEAHAILIGDAQQTLAFQTLSEDPLLEAKDAIQLIQLLSNASGANGMIGGQVIDIESENLDIPLDKLQQLHQLKTGALIKCALLMGAVQAERYNEIKNGLSLLGEKIGLAFQVQDDILDIEADTQT